MAKISKKSQKIKNLKKSTLAFSTASLLIFSLFTPLSSISAVTATPKPNNYGTFLRVQPGSEEADGESKSITLNLTDQTVKGDIIVNKVSSLSIDAKNTIIISAINHNNTGSVSLKMSEGSILSLTADSYLLSFENDDDMNYNVYSNGQYRLFVNDEEVAINGGTYVDPTDPNNVVEETKTEEEVKPAEKTENNNSNIIIYIIITILILIILAGIIAFIIIYHKNNKSKPKIGDVPPTIAPTV